MTRVTRVTIPRDGVRTMSEAAAPDRHDRADDRVTVTLDTDRSRLERAADQIGVAGVEAVVQEATARLVGDVLDDGGDIPCPYDDCPETFATYKSRRGHLGSATHTDKPEGEFWCGYCGYGPSSWRGISAHHGQTDHDGDPVRLDYEPEEDDLIAPDDLPDHRNKSLLRRLYDKHDGNYSAMCRDHDFEVAPPQVRRWLIEFGIHEPTPQGQSESETDGKPVYRDSDWLRERYEAADGNISEMHRNIDDVDVAYRTLVSYLREFDIHKPQFDEADTNPDADDESPESEADSDSDTDDSDAEPPSDSADSEPDTDHQGYEFEHLLAVDSPDEVAGFGDLATPDWLREASFFTAVDEADNVDDLKTALGWGDPEDLSEMVRLLDADLGGKA